MGVQAWDDSRTIGKELGLLLAHVRSRMLKGWNHSRNTQGDCTILSVKGPDATSQAGSRPQLAGLQQ